MKTETARTTQTPEDVLNELRSLVIEAEQIVHQSEDGNCESAVAAMRERFEAAQAKLTEFYDGAKKKVVSGARYTDHAIRENPYQALAITLGVGVLVGVLIGRRSR
jgi:ElaB/YqjD/DUF883 family membrane-anchored ribosome-binding protein